MYLEPVLYKRLPAVGIRARVKEADVLSTCIYLFISLPQESDILFYFSSFL